MRIQLPLRQLRGERVQLQGLQIAAASLSLSPRQPTDIKFNPIV
jgi:hypothetical protein